MSKKRVLAGIMSLLLLITSVFTGNVVTKASANTGNMEITISGNGYLDYTFYSDEGATTQCTAAGAAGYVDYATNGGVATLTIPGDAVKVNLKPRGAEGWTPSSFTTGDALNNYGLTQESFLGSEGQTITVSAQNAYDIGVTFTQSSTSNSGISYGSGNALTFKVNNNGNGGTVTFAVTNSSIGAESGTTYTVGGDATNDDAATKNALNGLQFASGDTITISATPITEANYAISNFSVLVNGSPRDVSSAISDGKVTSYVVTIADAEAGKPVEVNVDFQTSGGTSTGNQIALVVTPSLTGEVGTCALEYDQYDSNGTKLSGSGRVEFSATNSASKNETINVASGASYLQFKLVTAGANADSVGFALNQATPGNLIDTDKEALLAGTYKVNVDGTTQIDFSPVLSVSGGTTTPTVGNGDVSINVQNGELSTVQYSTDGSNWSSVPSGGIISAETLSAASQVYLKATPATNYSISSASLAVGEESATTIDTATLEAGTYSFTYGNSAPYYVNITYLAANQKEITVTLTSGEGYLSEVGPGQAIEQLTVDGNSVSNGKVTVSADASTHKVGFQLGYGYDFSQIDINGSTTQKTNMEDAGSDWYYVDNVATSDTLTITITKAASDVVTIIWSTNSEDAAKTPEDDATYNSSTYVANGSVEIVSITRNGDIIYQKGVNETNLVSVTNGRGMAMLKKGDNVVLKLIPNYGYQLKTAEINDQTLTPAGTDFANVSTFILDDIQGNMHFSGAFESVADTITTTSSSVSTATITNGANAATSGTLALDVADGTADATALAKAQGTDTASSYTTVATLDLTLDNVVSMGTEGDNWTQNITEFDNDITVGLNLSGITVADGEELVVVRKHGSAYDTLSSASLSGNTLSVPTNKFSTYTIVKKTAKKDLSTADVTLDQTSYTYDGSAKTPTISVDAAEINASDYTISYANSNGKTGADANKTAGTVTVTITAKDTNANYKGTTTKTFTIAKADPSIGTVSLDSNFGSIYTSTSVAAVSAALTRTNTTVPGTLELTDVTSFATTGTDNYNWKFTPTDELNYQTNAGTISLTVLENTLSSLSVSGSLSKTAYAYGDEIDLTGITVTATFANGDTLPVPITDTNLTYTETLAVGQTSVTLTYTNNDVAKTADVTGFTVSKAKIDLAGLAWTGTSFTYNGSVQGPTFTASLPTGAALDGEYANASKTDAGDYTAVANIKLADGYSGTNYEFVNTANTAGIVIAEGGATATVSKAWSIARKSITGATITLGDTLTYNGTTQTQTVSSVAIGESALTSGTDYTITGNEQKDAGTYTLTVTGNGNYTGTATKQFTIGKASLTPALSGTTTKVYDNKTTVTATNDLTLAVTGLKNSETVTVTAAAYAYDNANVGSGKTITATGITISGEAAKNYALSGTTATVAGGEITQATPTITLSNLSETTQAPTGAKATLTPADATANVVVEYKVVDTPAVAATPEVPCNVEHEETCASKEEGNTIADCNCNAQHTEHTTECGYKAATAGTPATYKWVNTRPTTPGTYEVRAYLPTGTTNVAAIAVENAVTGSYTLTQYTAPAGDNTSNNTGSSSSSGSTTTTPTTPATTTPEAPAATDTTKKPATKKPATQTAETTAEKTTGVTSEDGASGWTDIENEISDKLEAALEAAGEDGETETVEVVVEMNGEKKIPTDIFEAIKGQNIVVTFEMGDGIVWTVNGMDVTADKFDNISFGASTGSGVTAIPAELIAGIAGENFGMELTLEYEGEFGFTAVMSVNVDKKNAGKYANLFYFNPKTETMEFICSAPVKEDGTTDLTFTHASDYVIVVSDATMSAADNTSLEDVQGAESGDTSDEPATGEVTTDKKAWTPIWIIVIGAFVIIIGGIVLFAVKKKND